MKKFWLIILGLSASLAFSTNTYSQNNNLTHPPTFIGTAEFHGITKPLRDLEPVLPYRVDGKEYIVPNNFRRNKIVNHDALPKGDDPVWQRQAPAHFNSAPIIDWDGVDNTETWATPPDPSGAVGPNHYFEMVNTAYKIFDKSGNLLYGPSSLSNIWGNGVNDGDPVVIYDRFADRWMLTQFRLANNALLVALSQTGDPLGSYYLYEFPLGTSFPDYPKYSVWQDGYYVTANKSGDNVYALERDQMLIGNTGAQIIGFTTPNIVKPGFTGTLPAMAEGSTLPPPGTPCYVYYFQDDAWSGVAQDEIKIWSITTDWVTPTSSAISSPQEVAVSAFDSDFTSSWDDLPQPNGQYLDGIPGAFMLMAPYRRFGSYNSVVLNHTVDVDGTNHGGIRWYELRESGGTWSLYQEGTFAPDADSRWVGSIEMDYQGNIGLAYSVTGTSTFPSIRYTGRYANDPLGQLTLTEATIINGTSSQSGTNRYGDYAQMTLDPGDDATFWYVGEYMSSGWRTRIAAFRIAPNADNDVGVASIDGPVDGLLTGSETITVTVNNFGTFSQSNFPVSFQVNGGPVTTETYTGTLGAGNAASFSFAGTANMSSAGAYLVKAWTGMSTDQFNPNDTSSTTITHLFTDDIGVSAITAPASSNSLGGAETVTVTVHNYGAVDQSNFPVSYVLNNGTPVTETYTSTLSAGSNASYSFSTTADLSNLGTYQLTCFTDMASELNRSNDTAYASVDHQMCMPVADCSFGDGFTLFQLNTINNATGCSSGGYSDYSTMSTDLYQGQTYTVTVNTGYDDQHMTLWIDFNDNYVFETSEALITNYLFGTAGGSTSITIPAGAATGQHLLRARTNWQADVNDPCVDVSYGETEDYTVNILIPAGLSLSGNVSGIDVRELEPGLFNVSIKALTENAEISVHNSIGQCVYRGELPGAPQRSADVDLRNLAKGHYLIRISNPSFSMVRKLVYR